MTSKKPTVEERARLVRVTPATVSRVANRIARVSPAAEKRVRASTKKIGFDLRGGSSKLIAFLLANRSLLNRFHSQVLVVAEDY